jgi:hypothetical protein
MKNIINFLFGLIPFILSFLMTENDIYISIAPALLGGIVAGAGSLLGAGGALATTLGGAERERELQQQRLGLIEGLDLPTLEALTGQQLTPEAIQALTLGPTAFGDITTDPRLRQAQLGALQQLQQIGAAGGLTPQDIARQELINQQIAQQQRGSREALLQQAGARGLAGTGAELGALLASQQAGTQARALAGTQTAAEAQRRALQAILQSGQLGGQIRGQEFGEQAQAARARDIINQFNIQNRQQTLAQNVAARNLARQQNIQQQTQAQQQFFQNQLAKLGLQQQALGATGQEQARREAQTAGILGGLGEAAGRLGGTLVTNPGSFGLR